MLGNESILSIDYRIDGDTLYRYEARAVDSIVPWGPEAAARRFLGGVWRPFTPEIDVASLEETARHPGPTRWPGWRRRVAACRFLVERWPEEARDGVRRFSSAHWELLQFINAGGAPALELLRSNPALGYLAAKAGAASRIGLRRRSLAALFGFPETEHAVRLLRKAPAAWISCEFLAQLRAALMHAPDADATLTHLTRINPVVLELARDPELRASVAPPCLARLSRLPASGAHAEILARMRELLENARGPTLPRFRIRTLADLDRPVCAAPVPPPAVPLRHDPPAAAFSFPAPPRNLTVPAAPPPPPVRAFADLERPVCIVQLPPPPPPIRHARRTESFLFPAPPLPDLAVQGVRISAIRSQPDLVAEGDAMQHCAGRDKSYARRVAGGGLYFYRMLEPERLTIAIRPARHAWTVQEIRGFRNRQPCGSSRTLVSDWLWQAAPPPPRRCPSDVQLAFDFTL